MDMDMDMENSHTATAASVETHAPAAAAGLGYIVPKSRSVPLADMALRISVTLLSLLSLCLIASDPDFSHIAAFNYLLAGSILCFFYSVAQSVISGHHFLTSGRHLVPESIYAYFSIFSDVFCSILLLSGCSAVFGATTNFQVISSFSEQANAAASMALLGFALMLPLIVLSWQRFSSAKLF